MKKIFSLLLTFILVNAVFAQTAAKEWSKKFPGNVKWYHITDAGILVVCTGDALYGINPDSGEEIWKADNLDDIKEENYDPIEGTPYAAIVKQKAFSATGTRYTIIDVVKGKILADTKELDMIMVTKRIHVKELNSMIFFGLSKTRGKPFLVMISLEDGHKVWEQNKLFEKNSEEIVSNGLATNDGIYIATTKNIYKLNQQTGEILWSVDMKTEKPVVAVEQNKKSGFGKLMGGGNTTHVDLSANATSTSAQFFLHNNNNDKVYFWNQDVLLAYNNADGKPLTKEVELQSPVAYILYDTHGMIVTTTEKTQKDQTTQSGSGGGLLGKIKRKSAAGKNRASILCIDPETGLNKWGDEIDLKGDVNAYKMVGNKLILATETDGEDNYISIIDLDAGKSLTKKPLSIKGEIRDLEVVPQGLYYRTSDEINILDLETGDRTWKKGFKVKNCVGDNADNTTGYVYANEKIYKIDFTAGDIREWVTGVDFNGKEDPTSLQVRSNGVLLTSDQNATLYSQDGKVVWHTYNKAPGRTGMGKVLSGLGGLAAAVVATASTANSAQLSYAKGYYGSTDPVLDNAIKTSQVNAANFAGAAASSFASISRRFKATIQANDFMVMLTALGGNNEAKNSGAVIINKIDGKNVSSILLGDKTPDYKLDELGRMIFQKSENDEIKGFKF
ncbi:MAG: PQQ-binding-like beta-propeller repeat protein [Sphingobacteriales bacterium]|nr:PQQ-binding-like beta-propeller repeat protein [Sphingobacteriales bacterium]